MFFSSRKKEKLAEEAQKLKQQRIQEEAEQNRLETIAAFDDNVQIFRDICHMVRSLPKKRHIVVVQRENIFRDDSRRNWYYLQMARKMQNLYHRTGQRWVSAYGINNDCLYAFYEPTEFSVDFRLALEYFSKGGYRIQRIRYFSRYL